MLDLVVFSKDRPAQLELLLRSMRRFFPEYRHQGVSVLYTASAAAFDDGYAVVRRAFPELRWVDERTSGVGFWEATLGLLGERPLTAFMVDDNVFRTPFSLGAPEVDAFADDPEILCLSLRMAPWMGYCYPLDRPAPPPAFERGTVWRWPGAAGDWGYPMSADGHLFRTAEIAPLLARLPFANPNTLEAAMAASPLAPPKAICLPESVIVNNPANRVQDVARNRSGSVSPEWLNDEFLRGRRLSIAPFVGLRNPSPHHEVTYEWEDAAPRPAPRVSVVIPCFNYGHHLAEAVESVLAQTLLELELVIVDDGSTDDSAAVAERLVAEHPERAIRLLRQERSGHPAHARNAGVRAARAELVLCLDADDALEPGFLEACVGALERDPEAGIAYGDQQDFGGRELFHRTPAWDPDAVPHGNFIGTASVFRRAAWEAAGGYDAEVGYEDWDLWIGIAARGWRGIKVPGAVWRYRVHGEGRFAKDSAEDRLVKARIVLKRPALYGPNQLRWARGVLDGDPGALAVPDAPGLVPRFEEPVAGPAAGARTEPGPAAGARAEPGPEGVRSFSTVALACEVLARPELVAAYAGGFDASDDATLVIYAPGDDESSVAASLGALLARIGLDGPSAPDMVALTVPAAEGDRALARTAHAALTHEEPEGVLAGLPRFGVATLRRLRALAERRWSSRAAALVPDPVPEHPMARMYGQFIRPGDLVFDVGANLGNRTEAFLALGARVVAVEPQPACAAHLRARWPGDGRLTILETALSDHDGEAELYVSDANTLTSMSPDWIAATVRSGRFAEYRWDERITVPTTTLAALIARHGVPAFCKVDVEGFEATVLAGLDRPLPALSIEFTKETLEGTRACVERLAGLGPTEFNFSLGESLDWALPGWVSAEELMARLEALPDAELPWGDVYARSAGATPAPAARAGRAVEGPIPEAGALKALAARKGHQRDAYEALVARVPALHAAAPEEPALVTGPWRGFLAEIERAFLPAPPFGFLRHPLIVETMFVTTGGDRLARQVEWLEREVGPRLGSVVEEDYVGEPLLQEPRYLTSHNAVMHLYHLARFSRSTGADWSGLGRIVEWGGGYGSMARLIRRLAEAPATHVLIDLPVFCVLQWLYLATVFGEDEVKFVTEDDPRIEPGRFNVVPNGLAGRVDLEADVFISTWALSESTPAAQDYVAGRNWFGARHLLLGFQRNNHHFSDAERVGGLAVADGAVLEELELVPGNCYAFR